MYCGADPLGLCRDCQIYPSGARVCEQLGVIEVPKNLRQESVERVKILLQEQMSERTGERIGVIYRCAQDLKPGKCRGSQTYSSGANF